MASSPGELTVVDIRQTSGTFEVTTESGGVYVIAFKSNSDYEVTVSGGSKKMTETAALMHAHTIEVGKLMYFFDPSDTDKLIVHSTRVKEIRKI